MKDNKILQFIISNHYTLLIVLSSLIMTVAGAVFLPKTGETYFEQQALAGTAIHYLKSGATQDTEDDLIDIAALGGQTVTGGDGEDEYEDEDEDEDIEEAVPVNEDAEALEDALNEASDETKTKEPSGNNDDQESQDKDEESSSKKKKKKKREWTVVDESYFDDALFIGDSRQQGFGMYSGLKNITVYAEKSNQITLVSSKQLVQTPFGKLTVTDALALNQHRFKKVYIMFGINEMGSGDKDFSPYYYNLIDYIKLMEPDATIYLEGIIHVTANTAAKRPALSNDKIDAKNEILKKVAKDEGIVYLDLNEVLTDENNALYSDAAADGIHLKSEYIKVLKEYLMAHAVVDDKSRSGSEDEASDEDEDSDDKKKDRDDEFPEFDENGDSDDEYDDEEDYEEEEAELKSYFPDGVPHPTKAEIKKEKHPYVDLNEAQAILQTQFDILYRHVDEFMAAQPEVDRGAVTNAIAAQVLQGAFTE